MKKQLVATILAFGLFAPMAQAAGPYGGLALGHVSVDDDVETVNLGIALGNIAEHGFGYELFYSFSVVDDSGSSNGLSYDADTDVLGAYVVYQTPGNVYFKGKLGYGFSNVTFDFDDQASIDESEYDFTYGIGGGFFMGDGALEFTYYRFPEIEEVDGMDVDADVEMFNLTYLWTF